MTFAIMERTVATLHGAVKVLDLQGKITIGEGSLQLRDAVQRLLQNDEKQIILNLTGITYVDSSGIGELVSCFTTTKHQGGRLKLLNPPKKVKDLLMITKLLAVFEIYDDELNALGSFG